MCQLIAKSLSYPELHESRISEAQDSTEHKLPLYGPLDIKNDKAFFKESKEEFFNKLKTHFHSDVFVDDYDVLVTLGRGSFGTVKLLKERNSDNYYAAKIQLKSKIRERNCIERVFIEKRVLYSLDFPFCVRMEHYCHNEDYIYFLLPYIRGGELYTLIKKFGHFNEEITQFYAAQVVLVLEFFQYIHFVYRDLKPENILVDHTGFLKITDFGLSKKVDSRTYTTCGTPTYMAPEVLASTGYARSLDWWSLGILIFEMRTGKPPYKASSSITLFTKILYAPLSIPDVLSSDLKNILRGLLTKDVSSRLGNLKNGALDVKKHPWFKEINWLQLLNRRVPPPYVPRTSGPADISHFPYAKGLSKNTNDDKYEKPSINVSLLEDPEGRKLKIKFLKANNYTFLSEL